MQGTIRWFDTKKGYGFIIDPEGKDIFVHQSTIVMDGFRYLNEDDIVDFDVIPGKDGRNLAVNVIPVLTMKMIKDALKEDGLYVKNMKDSYKVTKYLVVDANGVLQINEQGMTFLELAEYANFKIIQQPA